MNKAKSILKKAVNLDLEAYDEGKLNYDVPTEEMENLAKKRLSICQECKFFEKEPIKELQVNDELIPELSNMMCGSCGCSSPYLLRQTIKRCNKDKW